MEEEKMENEKHPVEMGTGLMLGQCTILCPMLDPKAPLLMSPHPFGQSQDFPVQRFQRRLESVCMPQLPPVCQRAAWAGWGVDGNLQPQTCASYLQDQCLKLQSRSTGMRSHPRPTTEFGSSLFILTLLGEWLRKGAARTKDKVCVWLKHI